MQFGFCSVVNPKSTVYALPPTPRPSWLFRLFVRNQSDRLPRLRWVVLLDEFSSLPGWLRIRIPARLPRRCRRPSCRGCSRRPSRARDQNAYDCSLRVLPNLLLPVEPALDAARSLRLLRRLEHAQPLEQLESTESMELGVLRMERPLVRRLWLERPVVRRLRLERPLARGIRLERPLVRRLRLERPLGLESVLRLRRPQPMEQPLRPLEPTWRRLDSTRWRFRNRGSHPRQRHPSPANQFWQYTLPTPSSDEHSGRRKRRPRPSQGRRSRTRT